MDAALAKAVHGAKAQLDHAHDRVTRRNYLHMAVLAREVAQQQLLPGLPPLPPYEPPAARAKRRGQTADRP